MFLFQFIAWDKLNKLLEKALVAIHLNNFILTQKLKIFIYTSVNVQGMQEKVVVIHFNKFILTKKLHIFIYILIYGDHILGTII